MPKATSKKQQMAAGAALSAKRGERGKSSLKGASKSMYESMSKERAEEDGGNETEEQAYKEITLAKFRPTSKPQSGCVLQPTVGRFGYPGIADLKYVQQQQNKHD
jgi:hypothetical protein